MRRANAADADRHRRKLLGGWPLGHRGIGDHHRLRPADDDIDPEWRSVQFIVDHCSNLA